MADIRYDYEKMTQACAKIRELGTSYQQAGQKMVDDFATAISSWEGDSKDKMSTLMNGAVKDYVTKSIPDALEALAQLLEQNASNMQNADNGIADQIPQTLQ